MRTQPLTTKANHGIYISLFITLMKNRRPMGLDNIKDEYLSILNSLSEGVWILDKELKFKFINEAGARFIGLPPEQILGREITEVLPEINESKFVDLCKKIRGQSSSKPATLLLTLNRGINLLCKIQPHPFIPKGILCISRDIEKYPEFKEKVKEQLDTMAKMLEKRRKAHLKSEERFETIVKICPLDILVTQDNKFVYTNFSVSPITGFSKEEIVNLKYFWQIVTPEYRKLVKRNYEARLKGKYIPPYECKLLSKTGEEKWVIVVGSVIEWKGRPADIVMLMDITELKQKELKLRESEKQFHMLFENAAEAIYFFDPQSKQVLEANPSFFTYLGYKPEEISNLRIYDFIAHDKKSIDEHIQSILDSGTIVVGERKWRRKDGTLIDVLVSAGKVPRKGKTVIFTIATDITQLKNMERALQDAVTRLKAILEATPDLLFIINRDGVILDYYAVRKENLYTQPIEFLNKKVTEVLPSDVAERVMKAVQEVFSTGEMAEFELSLKVRGEVRHREARIVKLNENEVLAVVRDVTQLKKTERKLRETYKRMHKGLQNFTKALAKMVESRDPYTAGHQERVAELAVAIAKEMGLPERRLPGIKIAGLLHDMGKISIPAEILTKPTQLSEIELALVKTHPQVAYEVLREIDFPWPVAEIIYQHHERWDGSGYPRGLKDDEILLEARILAVADVVEAMSSHRPYRPAHSIEEALEELTRNKGKLYDPEVVEACVRLFKEKKFSFESVK